MHTLLYGTFRKMLRLCYSVTSWSYSAWAVVHGRFIWTWGRSMKTLFKDKFMQVVQVLHCHYYLYWFIISCFHFVLQFRKLASPKWMIKIIIFQITITQLPQKADPIYKFLVAGLIDAAEFLLLGWASPIKASRSRIEKTNIYQNAYQLLPIFGFQLF